ncbi:hypothetical protein PRZ48_000472 [Zasmidium cellare]|uniref:Peptidase S8/S53 domain-containing protein n=1 Tax=Zasmidium cellare TaxID=395010 RepID=A0ABR0EYK3_ZASCE|nr:hypothetical protein PRZ48_000472 [Zasmidium cellare]
MDFFKSILFALLSFFISTTLSAPAVVTTVVTVTADASTPTSSASTHESGGEEHIVIINKNAPVTPQVAEVLKRLDLDEGHSDVRHVFNNSAFQGFAASMKSHCLDLLANMSDVSMVEKAVTVTRADIARHDAPWGLQRISTSSSFAGSPQDMDYTYTYTSNNLGEGSDVYIIDTGIYTSHNVFNGRASMLWSFDNDLSDKDGHGTHVAGTAAGSILGVASNANIHGIKALDADGGGWSSNVVAAIDYVINRHDARSKHPSPQTPFSGSVISMSLATSSPVSAITAAVEAATAHGIHTIVAAGNSGTDACTSSPASSGGTHGQALTIGAIDISNAPASFSNSGPCVDLYAPGVDIVSSWIGSPNMVNVLSGTSMATPHVTGIVAVAMAGNETLARNPGLMKEWVRMVAVDVGDGVLVANNGVRGQGAAGNGKRAFSGLDASGRCRRESESTAMAAWMCNAKRSLRSLAGLLS